MKQVLPSFLFFLPHHDRFPWDSWGPRAPDQLHGPKSVSWYMGTISVGCRLWKVYFYTLRKMKAFVSLAQSTILSSVPKYKGLQHRNGGITSLWAKIITFVFPFGCFPFSEHNQFGITKYFLVRPLRWGQRHFALLWTCINCAWFKNHCLEF